MEEQTSGDVDANPGQVESNNFMEAVSKNHVVSELEVFRCENQYLRMQNAFLKRQLEEKQYQFEELKKRKESKDATTDHSSVNAGKVLPVLGARGYLKLQHLLECRLVFRDWQKQVDFFLEESFLHCPFDKTKLQRELRRQAFKALPKSDNSKLASRYSFSRPEKLNRFLNAMKNADGNPFIGKTASFDTINVNFFKKEISKKQDAHYKMDYTSAETFLSKFGGHLRCVTLNFKCFGDRGRENCVATPLNLYKTLEIYLAHFENVNRLEVCVQFYSSDLKLQSQWSMQLREYMVGKRLPPLKDLRHLELRGEGWTKADVLCTAPIINAILEASPYITSLYWRNNFEKSAELIGKLPLRELELVAEARYYKCLNNVYYGLEKLEFCSNAYGYVEDFMQLSELLAVLKRFPNLCDLKITGCILVEREQPIIEDLSVENLTLSCCYKAVVGNKTRMGIFEDVFHTGGFYNYVISHFPNIRFLNIKDYIYSPNNDITDTDESLVYRSAIWTELKSLEVVTMRYHVSKRNRGPGFYYRDCCWTRKSKFPFPPYHWTKDVPRVTPSSLRISHLSSSDEEK